MQSVAELVSAIRQRGGRITPQRIAVIEAINESLNHPTIDEIYDFVSKKQKSLSKKTVYQITNDLHAIGAIELIDVGTGQLRIDPNTEMSHDHYVCISCKAIFDIQRKKKPTVNSAIEDYGNIESVEVVYRGRCNSCISKN